MAKSTAAESCLPQDPRTNHPMSNNEHPITPPLELVVRLRKEAPHGIRDAGVSRELHLIAAAYQAGVNAGVDACCEYIGGQGKWFANPEHRLRELRAACHPKPPSLKEQALKMLEKWSEDEYGTEVVFCKGLEVGLIRRALQQLPD